MGNQSRAVAAKADSVPQIVAGKKPAADERSCPGKGILWGGVISAALWLILITFLTLLK